VGYAGTTLLETPPAQQGIARLAGAFEGFGMAPAAAFLLAGALAGTAVFGALSAGIAAAGAQSANEANIVYRALNAKDAERLAAGLGLEAKNPAGTWTAAQHVARGSSRAALANDPWIATTSDLNVARAFKSGNGIAKIDLSKVPGPGVRVWEYAPRASGQAGIPYNYSIWQQETSIYRNIPRDAILDLLD
jgi:hypothetical protein